MNQSHYYRLAIDILIQTMNGSLDAKEILQNVAKKNPKVLCDACNLTPWESEARRINATEGKVPAIKFVRSQTGLGLKEAKEYMDKWSHESKRHQ